jgi:hypothetical protein
MLPNPTTSDAARNRIRATRSTVDLADAFRIKATK